MGNATVLKYVSTDFLNTSTISKLFTIKPF